MNLKNAQKVISAYKTACSDGVPPTNNFDWQPSPVGYKMSDLMLMVGEILNLRNKKIYFSKNKRITHYDITPYAFDDDLTYKLNSKLNIDLGQGILNLIKDIKK